MENQNLQTEIDAWYLYKRLAENEADPLVQTVFAQMSEIERGHAEGFLHAKDQRFEDVAQPSWRAKWIDRIGRIFGYGYVLGVLMDTEKGLASAVMARKAQARQPLAGNEDTHVTILRTLMENQAGVNGLQLSRLEKRHRSVGGNAIRAAVFGGNDGLVSNFSLVMGVAGATAGQSGVLLTGLAGLLAGALSMALGEWISVRSSQELYENQMQLEMEELETNPEGELKELTLIYIAKGVAPEQAATMAAEVMQNRSQAHNVLVREELGINPEDLQGSAMEAAISSFVLFAIGAVIPVLPFIFTSGSLAIALSVASSALGLFMIGSAITLFTRKNVWYSGFRQVIFGLIAAAITFGIGKLIGISLG